MLLICSECLILVLTFRQSRVLLSRCVSTNPNLLTMFFWRVDVLCRVHSLRSSCLPLIWLLRSYWDNKVESGHYSYTHMVPISPWRPCHCTGLLLHALLANCWKRKNALGSGQKFTAQCMLGHLILFSNSNLLHRPRWSLIKAEMKGRQKTGLALVSCSFQTFMRQIFILSQLLTNVASKDTCTQVLLVQKQRVPAKDKAWRGSLWQFLFPVIRDSVKTY